MSRTSQTLSTAFGISRVTLAQLVRDPAVLIIGLGALFLVAGAPLYAVFQFFETRKVMTDTGLSSALLAGTLIALFGPARALAYELEDRTALNLLSKPLGRWTLVAGKYCGVLAAAVATMLPLVLIAMYVVRYQEGLDDDVAGPLVAPMMAVVPLALIFAGIIEMIRAKRWKAGTLAAGGGIACLIAVLVSASIKVYPAAVYTITIIVTAGGLIALAATGRRPWTAWLALTLAAAAGVLLLRPFGNMIGEPVTGVWRMELPAAGALVMLEVAVVAAAATAAAARFGTVGTTALGLAVLMAGHARGLIEARRVLDPVAGGLGLLPGLDALSGLEAAAAGVAIPNAYVALAAVYALLYVLALLFIGAALLQSREVA